MGLAMNVSSSTSALPRLLPAAVLVFLTGCPACAPASPAPFCPNSGDLAAFVDPMIGTQGSGNVVPGALVPHGMVKLSPDTNAGAGSIDAYDYDDDRIEGFSHTHLEGPGGSGNGYSQILFVPMVGPLKVAVEDYQSRYSHATEEASPGYYAVTLDDPGVRAELTATAHAGFQRYTFPATPDARLLIDLGHSRGGSIGGEVTVVDDHTIEGSGAYQVHPVLELLVNAVAPDPKGGSTGQSTVYFHAEFSKAFSSSGTFQPSDAGIEPTPGSSHAQGARIGAFVGFPADAGEAIEVRVGLSMVSVEQAKQNLATEVSQLTFEQVRERARAAWNCELGRVELEGGSEDARTTFYTALYHSLIAPTDYTEPGDVYFSGADGLGGTFTSKDHHYYSDDWCAWDTYRTARPLATLLEPEVVDDVVFSYLDQYQRGGWLQKCPWNATGNSRVMSANPEVAIIADAMSKGFHRFDAGVAWEAVSKSADKEDARTLVKGLCGYLNVGTPPEYVQKGYVSHECDSTQSASMTLEYAYNDWCSARVAATVGKPRDQARYLERSGNYRNVWNPERGFMQGKWRDGSWVEPFDPAGPVNQDFTEANSWIYTWFVPHDVPGLIALMGGPQSFVTRLDQFFAEKHFDMGNEPDFHAPFLYNSAGAPWRTQAQVRSLLATWFSARPDGLPGNDDSGAMSAWYVFGALGLYPVAPGDGVYQLSSPLFDRTTIHLHPGFFKGRTFVIEAQQGGEANLYIQSAQLNGKALTRPWLTHQELGEGGQLVLQMGPTPSNWGTP